MDKEQLKISLEVDLMKAKALPVGTKKVWAGKKMVKTADGWKPDTESKETDEEDGKKKKATEEPEKPKDASVEDYAKEAKDSQLEAALKDPKSTPEMKQAAKKELEARVKASGEEKVKEDTTEVKPEAATTATPKTEVWPTVKNMATRNDLSSNSDFVQSLQRYLMIKVDDFKEYNPEKYEKIYFYKNKASSKIDRETAVLALSDNKSSEESQIGLNLALMEAGKAPVMSPFLFERYKGKSYENCDSSAMDEYEAQKKYDKELTKIVSKGMDIKQTAALEHYTGGYYSLINNQLRGISVQYENKEKAIDIDSDIAEISNYITEHPIGSNKVLSRRIAGSATVANYLKFEKGDVFKEEGFSSFSSTQLGEGFGNGLQITLLAKKGDPAANALNKDELEYVIDKDTNFRVLETGFNSILVEIVR